MKNKITIAMLLLTFISAFAQEVETYETLDAFQTSITENCASTDLTFEDFGGILDTACGTLIIPDPEQTCFAQDELEDGFTFQGRNPEGVNIDIIAGEQGEFGNSPINFVTPNNIFGTAVIDFEPPVEAVTFSLWGFLNNTGSTEITLFNDDEEIIEVFDLDTPSGELYFFSTISTTPIARVITTNPDPGEEEGQTGGGGSFIGELYFGAMGCTNLSVDNQALNQVKLAPNPATNFVNILVPQEITINSISVKTITGQSYKANYENNRIDISSMASGVYFVTINSNQGTLTKKLIIN